MKSQLFALALSSLLLSVCANATEPAVCKTLSGELHGTLELPEGTTPCPVVLAICGSGPTDRNGNNPLAGNNNCMKLLAEGLAANGIASLRYDKRAIGESAKAGRREELLSFENYIADAVSWGRQLQVDKRFDKLIVLGHSEGALIGMAAAEQLGAAKFIALESMGLPMDRLILKQLETNLSSKETQSGAQEALAALREGKSVDTASIPLELRGLFRPSVQPYLRSCLKHDPAREIAKLRMPVLLVQGSTDRQTDMEGFQRLQEAKPAARTLLVEGMNHVLKESSSDAREQALSYADPAAPLAPALLPALLQFIKEN